MKKSGFMPESYCDMHFTQRISRWDEAVPLGNGAMGCLVWGGGRALRLSVDRCDLWDMRETPETQDKGYTFQELLRLVENKQWQSVNERFYKFCFKPTPTKIPAGALALEFGEECGETDFKLDLSRAVCSVGAGAGGSKYHIRILMHATGFYGYLSVRGDAGLPGLSLKAPSFSLCDGYDGGQSGLWQLRYPAAEYGEENNLIWFRQKTCTDLEYALIAAVVKTGDSFMECAFRVASSIEGRDWFEKSCSSLLDAANAGYETILAEHEEWWRRYWEKSSVRICSREHERMWYISNYLFGSCSRKGFPPMPLQGLWTADDGNLPPWKGDYHNDLNTQLSYWHYLKANRLEEGECFVDFLWSLVPAGRSFAREFFDAPGVCLPSVMSINGKPLGGWPLYSVNLTHQIWLCHAFDQYWRYTGNKDFLRDKAYPYFQWTAECILRWLAPGADGKYRLPLPCSPEIYENTPRSVRTPNSNYDAALLQYLFATLRDMASELCNGEAELWESKRSYAPELGIGSNHELMISKDEYLEISHRHFSHALAIYPLKLLSYRSLGKSVIDATVESLEKLGSGLWVGYTFPWMAELYAIQGNGEGAAYQLFLFWENFCSQNGFHLNGDFRKRGLSSFHYRPFTLEGNMAAADALQEMLMRNDGEIIRAFPAIPNEWRNEGASFHNLRGFGGVLVSAEVREGRLQYIVITKEYDGVCEIENGFDTNRLRVDIGGVVDWIWCEKEQTFSVRLKEREVCKIAPA